jgi:hypothetical protein
MSTAPPSTPLPATPPDPTRRAIRAASKHEVAAVYGVTPLTVMNWLKAGHIIGYRLPGRRSLVFDLDQVAEAVAVTPSMRPPSKDYGPKARIVELGRR